MLLVPSNERIQIDRLKADIPKFFDSRVFEESHKAAWNDFLEDKEGLYKPPVEETTSWPLRELIAVKGRQNVEKDDEQQRLVSGILDIPRPWNMPTEVEAAVAAQIEDVPQVSLLVY